MQKLEGHDPMLDEANLEDHDPSTGPPSATTKSASTFQQGQEDTIMKHCQDRLAAKMWNQYSTYNMMQSPVCSS